MAALKLTVLLSVVAVAFCNDLHSGFADSRQQLIFEKSYEYSPTIYVRSETVNVNTHGDEIINQIEVIDKRELKDGEAKIIAGGIGQKSVTISLKGPAVFRGMSFLVKVWAVTPNTFGDKVAGVYNGLRNGARNVEDYLSGRSENYETQRNVELNDGLQAGTGLRADGTADGVAVSYGGRNRETAYGQSVYGRSENYDTQRNEELNDRLQSGTRLRADGTADGVSVSYGGRNGETAYGQSNYGTKTGSYVYDRQGQVYSGSNTKQ